VKKLRAAIYVRISLDREGRKAGVTRQRQDCEALCQRRGWLVLETFEDNDKSAFDGAHRPAYDRLCDALANGQVDVVVAYHHDRLWRDNIEQGIFLADGRKAGLKLVATLSGDFDPADADDEFISTILVAAARKSSQDTRRRMKRKQLEKAQRGEAHGGRRGFGHTQDRMKVVPHEAKLIREAARRIIKGESFRSIVMDFQRRGEKTAMGMDWLVPTMRDLMSQPRLIGLREHHGTLYPTEWAVILDRQTFESVQVILKRNSDRKLNQRAPRQHLLTGILRCSKCGGPMKGGRKEGRPRYVCPPPGTHRTGCGGMVILAEPSEEVVAEQLFEYLDTPKFAKALVRMSEATAGTAMGELVQKLDLDRAKIEELDLGLADNAYDLPTYRRLVGRVRERIAINELELSKVASVPHVEHAGQGDRLRKAWGKMTFDEKRDVLTSVLDHVDVLPAMKPANRFHPERLRPAWRY